MSNRNYNDRGGDFCLGQCGLAEGTDANTIKTVVAFDFCIDGVFAAAKAATDSIAIVNTAGVAFPTQAEETTCLYSVGITSAGAVKVEKGEEVLTADLAKAGIGLFWPSVGESQAVIGAFKVAVTGTGVTFQAGSDDLSKSGVTDTYYDLAALPSAPL